MACGLWQGSILWREVVHCEFQERRMGRGQLVCLGTRLVRKSNYIANEHL